MTIDIVEYGYWGKNTNLCVYLSGTPDDVRTAYPALAKSVDPSLSDSDIQAVLDKSSSGEMCKENYPLPRQGRQCNPII